MTVSFPEGFRCPPLLRDMYPDIEREMLKHIEWKARRVRRLAPYTDLDDAIQEGRMALLSALIRYDINKCDGSLKRYAGVALDNCYRDMVYRAMAQVRMPRGLVRDYDGEWRIAPVAPMSLDEMLELDREPGGEWENPEEAAQRSHLEEEAQRFKMRLLNRLKGREKDVFESKLNPSTELLKMCDNMGIELNCTAREDGRDIEVPNYAIAKFLGLSKNQVDWCIHKIKGVFTQLAKDIDFSALFGDAVDTEGWPMIHIDEQPFHNADFVRRVLASRKLDERPNDGWDTDADHFQEGDGCSRWVERYAWGMVIVVKMGDDCRTVVAEGERINLQFGYVFGKGGLREDLNDHIPWYREVVKRLKEAKKEAKK